MSGRPLRHSTRSACWPPPNCPGCYAEVHCCRMCLDYDPGVADACRDDRTEPPSNKEGANFCEFFRPRYDVQARGADSADKGASARAKLDSLFSTPDSSGRFTRR